MQKEFEYKNHLSDIEHVVSKLIIGKEGAIPNPVVSVIMPVYNHPDFFRKSLLSVLNQKCDFEYEIVVVDNFHPEFQRKNQQIVEELYCDKIRYYVNNENIGGVGSENRGIQLSRGEYITYCHDDDLLSEHALQILVNYSQKLPSEDNAIFGNLITIDENDNMLKRYDEWNSFFLKYKKKYKVSLYDFLVKNYTNGCGSLYRRKRLLEIGGFNADYIPCPDYALNVKYTSLYGSFAIRDITLKYRISQQSDSSNAFRYMIEANKKIFDSLIKTGCISRIYPPFLIKSTLACKYYHLYSLWAEKPNGLSFFFYRVINRLWLNILLFNRMLR